MHKYLTPATVSLTLAVVVMATLTGMAVAHEMALGAVLMTLITTMTLATLVEVIFTSKPQ